MFLDNRRDLREVAQQDGSLCRACEFGGFALSRAMPITYTCGMGAQGRAT